MAYLFTLLPAVSASQPFVGGYGIFQIKRGRTAETSRGRTFAFDITVSCSTLEVPDQPRSIITLHVFHVGETPRYADDSYVFASGLVVFGKSVAALSFHALEEDVQVLSAQQEASRSGTICCSYTGTIRTYSDKPGESPDSIDVLLDVGLPLGKDAEGFSTL